ncbi:MAG: riboflavin synthase [Mailhella sp.]|nr:riboflavin synthase [Mailhella sp.]
MFTGLVEGQGRVTAMEKRGGDLLFRFHPLFAFDKPEIGESVACNGVCLTVEKWLPAGPEFTAFASAETASCTNLGGLRVGSLVNMERAMQMGDRFGGHIVSGHVDCVAHVESMTEVGGSRRMRMAFDAQWSGEVVPKGSVTLDGISLTVNRCGAGWLEVNIIPETWRVTTAASWKPGAAVNMETDVIAKYVKNLLQPYAGGAGQGGAPAQEKPAESRVTMDFLLKNGFGL